MIAIFFALRQETASLKPQVNILKKYRHAHITFYQSELHGFPVTLVQTGIGENAVDAIQYLTKYFRVRLIVSSGFAGSVNPELVIGDLVIGKQVLYSTQEVLEGEIHIDSKFPCDTRIAEMAVRVISRGDYHVHYGDVLSVNRIVHQATIKKNIGENTSAIAVDMESFALTKQANALGIPFIVVRAISDGFGEDIDVHDSLVTKGGNVNFPAAALHLISKPHHLSHLNRLRKHSKYATDTLSSYLPIFITQIYNSLLT